MTEDRKDTRESATETRLRCMEDRQFRRWYETLRLRNENTADSYREWVIRVTGLIGMNPLSYVRLHRDDPEGFDDTTQDIANVLVRMGRAESTIHSHIAALKNWAGWCRCKYGRKLVIGKAPRRPVASKQRIPVQLGLRRVLDQLDLRSRACMGLRSFAGIRPGIMGNRTGMDGLRLKHLEDLILGDGGRSYEIKGSSLKINVPARLSKNGDPFFSFLGPEGIDYFTAYLDKRIADGEVLTPESPVIAPAKSCNRYADREFVRRSTLTEPISRAMKEAGISDSPYIWRSYFKTQLIIAQSKNGLLAEYVEFWMGHGGGIQATYSFRKELSAEVVQEMRTAYETKALSFLETRRHPEDDSQRSKEWKRLLLETFNVPEDEVEGLDLDSADPTVLRELMQRYHDDRLREIAAEAAATVPTPAPTEVAPMTVTAAGRQMVVPVEQVQSYVGLGWRYVYEARLPEGQALVEAPATPTGPAPGQVAVAG